MRHHYHIAFIGLGSIGSRHLCNVQSFLTVRGDNYTIDLYRCSLRGELPEGVSAEFLYMKPIPENRMYDVVFITNPTSMHAEAIHKFKDHTRAFFIEKPVVDNLSDPQTLETLSNLSNGSAYVACPLRYNAVLQYVHDSGVYRDAISVRAISSSYLPDWRPGQDYRQCYSAHRNMGGGVGIDLIHEWDYLTWLYGMPRECKSIQTKISSLEIDSDDLAIYLARTEKTAIELHLDYFGRSTVRELQLFLPEDTMVCDLVGGTVRSLRTGQTQQFDTERNAFQMREIVHFFEIVDGVRENDSTVEHALDVLKIAKG